MTLSKSTRYALYAALEMAIGGDAPVTVTGVAGRYGFPPTALAKVFQQLVRAGIAVGTRGVGGGYRLARPRSGITVLDVIVALEPPRAAPHLPPGDGADAARGLRQLFDEVDELARNTYASVSLETLARGSDR